MVNPWRTLRRTSSSIPGCSCSEAAVVDSSRSPYHYRPGKQRTESAMRKRCSNSLPPFVCPKTDYKWLEPKCIIYNLHLKYLHNHSYDQYTYFHQHQHHQDHDHHNNHDHDHGNDNGSSKIMTTFQIIGATKATTVATNDEDDVEGDGNNSTISPQLD